MRIITFLSLIAIVFCGCKHSGTATQASVKHTVIPNNNTPAAKKDCDADFDIFFKKFQADSLFQITHTKFPIKYTYVDDVDDEYKVVRKDIVKNKFEGLDFSEHVDAMKREYDRFTVAIEKKNDSAFYMIRGDDNGIYIDIKFAFENNCWLLVEIDEHSM